MHVFQWRFGDPLALCAYVPCAEPTGAAAAAVRNAARASGGGAYGSYGGTTSSAVQASSSMELYAPHWGYATALCFSAAGGGRFAGIGEGGTVALWRTDVLGLGGLGYADWTHHVSGAAVRDH